MSNDVYDVCARVLNCEPHKFVKFSHDAIRVINRYNHVVDMDIIDRENAITVTTSNQAVALIIEHELKDIAIVHGVALK